MIPAVNETHDPKARSWLESANESGNDFPIQNLPFGVFAPRPGGEARVGVAIGDQVVDVAAGHERGLFSGNGAEAAAACRNDALNALLALGPRCWTALRKRLFEVLRHDAAPESRQRVRLLPMSEVEMRLPARVGDYTDFYASIHHATNVGSMLRPQNPLLPNYKWLPVAYHGRASSLVPSGTPVRRPKGQIRENPDNPNLPPAFAPSRRLDYEAEAGFFIGPGNCLGEPVPIGRAEEHIFGLCLVNDWSARDLQTWEYQPLGPFLAKSFATTLSPWVVTLDALAPFRVEAAARAEADPRPLPHLFDEDDQRFGGIALTVEVWLSSSQMRGRGIGPMRLSCGSLRDMYWTIAQMLAHHASNGCNLRPGDLLATGTISGAEKTARGCLMELTWRGTEPVTLPTGEQRRFLEDGDEIIMRGYCRRQGAARIGFGECMGVVLPPL
ncbi:MAG: fumarylacetoacetase [Candidatus Korobacteraceae bacterium]